jgi:hypothetical protein
MANDKDRGLGMALFHPGIEFVYIIDIFVVGIDMEKNLPLLIVLWIGSMPSQIRGIGGNTLLLEIQGRRNPITAMSHTAMDTDHYSLDLLVWQPFVDEELCLCINLK